MARPAMRKCEPEAALKVRTTRACILAGVRRPESMPLSFTGQVGRSTNWDRRQRTRNWSSERAAGSSSGSQRKKALESGESTEFGRLAHFDLQLPIDTAKKPTRKYLKNKAITVWSEKCDSTLKALAVGVSG